MDSGLYLAQRAENEIKLAGIIFRISESLEIQKEVFEIKEPETYYSSVISHCYYAVFYSAKAYLLTKGIRTGPPGEHRKSYETFGRLVDSGEVDVELLKIYSKALASAEVLLRIFWKEKKKRGKFTYRTLPQANVEPAKESVENAKYFFKHIHELCERA